MGDGIFGAAGQIGAASIQSGATLAATQMQIDALKQQRQFVFDNLNPQTVQAQATAADVQNAASRLALQGEVDPALLQARYQSEASIANQQNQIGIQSGQVAGQATSEALAGVPGVKDAQSQMVDAALNDLKAGATLPPDVEAQLVQAGLEQSGMVTGAASGRGIGGQQLRTILGTAGLQLQAQRRAEAANLTASAQNLEASRQNILQGLFPKLSQTQLANLQGSQGVLGQSAGLLPQAGLGGQAITNVMLARVGATNQLAQSQANAAAQGVMAQGNIWGNAAGSTIPYLSSGWTSPGAAPDTTGLYSTQGGPAAGADWSAIP